LKELFIVPEEALAYRYRDVAVKTANPIQLIVMLYDGAIHSLQQAQEQLKRRDISGRARSINRALSIISELQASLNFEEGGDIALSLNRLYAYMRQQVFHANVEQRPEPLAEVAGLMENLRSAWRELVVQAQRAESATAAPQPGLMTNTNAAAPVQRSLNISG
jgi:flagellar secretion chaperone FliS